MHLVVRKMPVRKCSQQRKLTLQAKTPPLGSATVFIVRATRPVVH
jgi:hypothetical protein